MSMIMNDCSDIFPCFLISSCIYVCPYCNSSIGVNIHTSVLPGEWPAVQLTESAIRTLVIHKKIIPFFKLPSIAGGLPTISDTTNPKASVCCYAHTHNHIQFQSDIPGPTRCRTTIPPGLSLFTLTHCSSSDVHIYLMSTWTRQGM